MRRTFDPLTFIPSSDAIQKHLSHAQGLVKRLRVLLRVAREIETTRPNEIEATGRLSQSKGERDGR